MAKHEKQIPAEVLEVLKGSTITADTLTLPAQLNPKLYKDTMKVIAAAGGKWNRGKACHTFEKDPRTALGIALDTGVAIDHRAKFQAFFTPPVLAERMACWAISRLGHPERPEVLEPSAGGGALAKAMRTVCPSSRIESIEIQQELADALEKEGFRCHCGDFMDASPEEIGAFRFHAVVMNPPFQNGQDAKHVLHAWKFLRTGGVLVAIVSPGYTFRTQALPRELGLLVARYGIHEEELPAGTFKESGTDVRTMLIVLRK